MLYIAHLLKKVVDMRDNRSVLSFRVAQERSGSVQVGDLGTLEPPV